MNDNKTELGAIFYPTKDQNGNEIPFDNLYLPYIWKEIYLEGVYIDSMNQRKDLVIVDIGSQIGLTVKYFLPFAKKIYAVEPSPDSFAALKKNKEFNKWDNVELFNYALADKDGEMEFALNDLNRTMDCLVQPTYDRERMKGNGWNKNTLMVKTISFANFMKEAGIDEIDFVKFDAEGADDLILRSEGFTSIAHKIKAIEVEFHDASFPSLVQHMISLGFTARRYPSSAIIVLFTR
mgnify:CR=1 FL=1